MRNDGLADLLFHLDSVWFELQTHEVMEPAGQGTKRRANVYSPLVPVCFAHKTSEV